MKKRNQYYVVWKGRQPGIYSTWELCQAQVHGFPAAEYKAYPSLEAARFAFEQTYTGAMQSARVVTQPSQFPTDEVNFPPFIPEGYSVDAACQGNPGWMEYRCVENRTRRQIFHQGLFPDATNNVGEFLAIVHALSYFNQQGAPTPIYSDSDTAIGWVMRKRCRSRLALTERNAALFELITRAEAWLVENTYPHPVLKWESGLWGEIPADFGRK
jgi:ribonuclease HI